MNVRQPVIILSHLISNLPQGITADVPEISITGVVMDSRQVQPGCLFVAVKGDMTDGHRYIADAIERGAVAVVGTQPLSLPIPYIRVSDSRRDLAYLAAAFYGLPARQLVMIGVTGTDGKTTTANLIFNILRAAGVNAGMITTVNAIIGEEVLDTGFHVTTPDSPTIQYYLSKMVSERLSHVILEATSHGLAQHRVAACDFDIGVVTNITHEHLDYHGSYEAYRAAKGSLFAALANTPDKKFNPPHAAVLNRDDSAYDYLAKLTDVEILTYGQDVNAVFRAEDIITRSDGLDFNCVWQNLSGKVEKLKISSHLVGEYNVYNSLAAIALARGVLNLDGHFVQQGIASMDRVPGRMERLDLGQEFSVIVDFAHTPNALLKALSSARKLTSGRVIAVFGSAGLRDRAKRRLMAEVSASMADITILTAEDPRTESLKKILAEMAQGMDAQGCVEGKSYWRIADRREAIRYALRLAHPDDLVLVCGKGHEQSMCFGDIEYPWDDRVAVRAALAEQLAIPGPEMPYLPVPD